jgi:hypothetical protein
MLVPSASAVSSFFIMVSSLPVVWRAGFASFAIHFLFVGQA